MSVSRADVIRAGGQAAVAGGLLRIATSVAPVVIESESARQSLYFGVDLCLITGLLAFYASQNRRVGWPGSFGLAAALIGFGIIRANRLILSVDLYPIGSVAVACGLIVLTTASWSARISSAWLPLMFTASLLFGIVATAVPEAGFLFVVAGVVFGSAFACMGWRCWSGARRSDC
jgi:hypothetical protein